MRVAVYDTDDLEAARLGVAICPQVVTRVHLVELRRLRRVAARIEELDPLADASQQSTRFEPVAVECVADEREIKVRL